MLRKRSAKSPSCGPALGRVDRPRDRHRGSLRCRASTLTRVHARRCSRRRPAVGAGHRIPVHHDVRPGVINARRCGGRGPEPAHRGPWRPGRAPGRHGAASPVTGAETAVGGGHHQSTEGHADHPQHHGHGGTVRPVAGADTTGGAGQGQPTEDDADQSDHGRRGGPDSPGAHGEDAGDDRLDQGRCVVGLHTGDDRPEK